MGRKQKKTNIVFILSDDHGAWATGCYGNKEVITPTLDSLADEGIRFDNFYCTSPVCSPARASILTGRMPSQHGVHDWIGGGNINLEDYKNIELKLKRVYPYLKEEERKKYAGDRTIDEIGELETVPFTESRDYKFFMRNENTPFGYLDEAISYTELLSNNGYACGLSGKWHLGDSGRPQVGFDYWNVLARGGTSYMYPECIEDGKPVYKEEYVTDMITDNAIDFIKSVDSEKPFYVGVHYTAPHSPWAKDDQPEDIWDLYEDCAFNSAPIVDLHPWQRKTGLVGDKDTRKTYLQGYYSALTGMDNNIQRILDTLDELGIRENTLIIYTSDNGMNMGHHGVWGKGNGTFPMNMYDSSVKVPMIMSLPSELPTHTVCSAMLSHYDLMPTLLEFTETEYEQANDTPGSSFSKFLRGSESLEDRDVVIYDEYGPVRMIRGEKYKYIHRYPYGPHELYDMENDSNEEENLIEDKSYIEIIQDMRNRLEKWFIAHSDPNKDGIRENVTGKGQFNLVGNGLTAFS